MNNIKVSEKLYKKMELEYNDFILDLKLIASVEK